MRSTALITLLSGAAMAAPDHTSSSGTGGKDPIYDGVIYAPPVTATVTETVTAHHTKYKLAPPVTATITEYIGAPPVTATVTEYLDELYDQTYGNGYELGDIVVAPTVITETKTFTIVGRAHHKETTRTTELIQEWSIKEAYHYAATVTESSTTWAQEHITSTFWVEPHKSTGGFAEEPAESNANPSKISGPEGGYGGLKPQQTGSESHVTDIPEHSEPESEKIEHSGGSKEFEESEEPEESEDSEGFEKFQEAALKAEKLAAEKAAIEAAKKASEEANKESKFQVGQQNSALQSSASQVHKPSRPHRPAPTHRPSPFHKPSASKPSASPEPSTFATSAKPASEQTFTAPEAPVAQPSVPAEQWQGELLNTTDGTCGPKEGQIAWSCYGNEKGTCCSTYGHCGSEPGHCGEGCQSAFGTCSEPASKPAVQNSDTVGKPPHRTVAQRAVSKGETELENKKDGFFTPVLLWLTGLPLPDMKKSSAEKGNNTYDVEATRSIVGDFDEDSKSNDDDDDDDDDSSFDDGYSDSSDEDEPSNYKSVCEEVTRNNSTSTQCNEVEINHGPASGATKEDSGNQVFDRDGDAMTFLRSEDE
ncbi:hypothetical protein SLS60_009217 [Paraconiothyrium brasiliense]|uniref:Chitin-binding type-1 domain-containing protein n=1 Tax=Paraconiothyrium brasiliense TaxID=300254 RepID=A0ABR3QWN5_9PLEO